ncbi:MAG TPA: DUF1993 domain-containing protein [Rhodocyclaceae bacterium]|nr:DUF1993 domain-containing protein [Rhodocyclaceae bacterium]
MPLSLYDASIPVLQHMLGSLSTLLRKAEAHAAHKKIKPEVLINARLFPDMFPLGKQVQIATDQAKGCAARLAGIEVPKYEDTESTFEELQARLSKTMAFLDSVDAGQINGSETRDISLQVQGKTLEFKGDAYLYNWVLPNFYFHVTTAYNILRHNGIEIGKQDFLGG